MLETVTAVSGWFWDEAVWLPPGVAWTSFQTQQVVSNRTVVVGPDQFAQFTDLLLYPVPLAACLHLLRLTTQQLLLRPLATRLGLETQSPTRPQPPHPQLQRTAAARVKLGPGELAVLARQTGMEPRQVQRWLRQWRRTQLPSTGQKFCETGWRFIFYTFILVFGLCSLWDKPWLWDIRQCWHDYPFHPMTGQVWCYYMLELAFYWSLSISQWFDVRRKDFWEMFVHHNTTILLIMFSWTAHFTRIGTLVMLVHDCADPLLELAKLLRYANFRKVCDAVFVLFSLVWVVTR